MVVAAVWALSEAKTVAAAKIAVAKIVVFMMNSFVKIHSCLRYQYTSGKS
jgi:hypothetical protein